MPRLNSRSEEARRILAPGATHYEVLAITPSAARSTPALDAARRACVRLVHPDRLPPDADDAARRAAHDATARVNEAYTVLSSTRSIQTYHKTVLARTHTPCGECVGEGSHRQQKGFNGVIFRDCMACGGRGWLRKEVP